MLEIGQAYIGPSGETLTIDYRYPNCIGEIFSATILLGPVRAGAPVTYDGLIAAGYELQPANPDLESEEIV